MKTRSILVRIFGHAATLIHGDPLVLDRWRWLVKRLYRTKNGEHLIDIGCGSGSFTIGAALRGYKSLGLSWDEANIATAREREKICGSPGARFEIADVRRIHERTDLVGNFDVAICFENIEHILDDRKLMRSIAMILRPGGYLLLSAPYYRYTSMGPGDDGPFFKVENGDHVRRGYTRAMLEELCTDAGLVLESQSFCSGFLSQKLTSILRWISTLHPLVGWAAVLPLRIIPPMFDGIVTRLINYNHHSICIEAYKPRFGGHDNALSSGLCER